MASGPVLAAGRPEVVVITRASAGVGRVTARGASVGLIAPGRAGLECACRGVGAARGRALAPLVTVEDAEAKAAYRKEEAR